MRVGILVHCSVCGDMKQPIGRSAPLGASYCRNDECVGYWKDPRPGSLWPGESEREFGYPVGADATEERPDDAPQEGAE